MPQLVSGNRPRTRRTRLSDQDLVVLALVGAGLTEAGAARRLDISARTLRRRLAAICADLNVGTTIEAVTWAARRDLI